MRKTKSSWRTGRLERLAFIVGKGATSVYSQFVSTFLTVYLLMVGISPVISAGVLLAVKAWDAINDTLFGYMVDKWRFKPGKTKLTKWLFAGKYLPWYRVFFILVPIGFLLLFTISTDAPVSARVVQLLIGYFIYDSGLTVAGCLHSVGPLSITDNYEERNFLISWSNMGTLLGYIPPTVLGTALVASSFGYTGAAVVFSLIGLVFFLAAAFGVKEHNADTAEQADKPSYTLKDVMAVFKQEKNLTLLCIVSLIAGLFSTGSGLTLFVCYYFFNDAMLAMGLSIISMIPLLILIPIIPLMLKRMDKTAMMKLGSVLWIISGAVLYFPGPNFFVDNIWIVYAMYALNNVAFMFVATGGVTMLLPDIAESAKFKCGHDCAGIVSAAQSFANKVGTGLCSSFSLLLLGFFGWVSVEADSFEALKALNEAGEGLQSATALNGLWAVSFLVPVIGLLICLPMILAIRMPRKEAEVYTLANSGQISRDEALRRLETLGVK